MITTIARTEGAPLQVLEGRFGPYVTDGETNASLPKGTDPATLTLAAGDRLRIESPGGGGFGAKPESA